MGDIAGSGAIASIPGVSFGEVFGIGESAVQAKAVISNWTQQESPPHVRLGLQPHAPYSCDLAVYEAATQCRLPLSTHLAETLEEQQFTRHATGPLADMLRSFGVWSESIRPSGKHPIDLLAPHLANGSWVLAHLNYIEDRHIELLANLPVNIAYCPRASAYFGHPHAGHPPHRYREMIEAGINVTLGTDSIICLDTPDRISVLDDMRFLYQRDHTLPTTLLRMATINGATALGSDPQLVSLTEGPTLGLIGIPVQNRVADIDAMLDEALTTDASPQWVAGPFDSQVFST